MKIIETREYCDMIADAYIIDHLYENGVIERHTHRTTDVRPADIHLWSGGAVTYRNAPPLKYKEDMKQASDALREGIYQAVKPYVMRVLEWMNGVINK